MMNKLTSLSVLGVLLFAHVASAQPATAAPLARVEGRRIVVATGTLDAGCEPRLAEWVGSDLVIACADQRVRVLTEGHPGIFGLRTERVAPGVITHVFAIDGRTFVLVGAAPIALDALPLAPPPTPPTPTAAPPPTLIAAPPPAPLAAPAPAPATPAPAPRSAASTLVITPAQPATPTAEGPAPTDATAELPEPVVAHISAVHGAHVTIDVGTDRRVHEGQLVEVALAQPPEDAPTVRMVGRVIGVAQHHAEVELGFGEIAHVGDVVTPTQQALTRVLTDPTPHRSYVSLAFGARAWIDAAGIGTLDEASLTYRADIPFALRMRLFPFAALHVGQTSDQPAQVTAVVAGGSIDAMFDDRYFAIGVGIGFGSFVSSRIVRASPTIMPNDDQRVGFLLAPSVRIGSVDGLHVAAQFSALSVVDEFRFGGFDVSGQVPIVPGLWLSARGGYWISGMGLGDLGLRIAVDGNGAAGTLFITPTIGIAGMDTGIHGFRAGPTIGVGLETRFGV